MLATTRAASRRPAPTGPTHWHCEHEGVFPFHDGGNYSGGEDGTNVHGLFGALIVEPEGTKWRDPVTGRVSHEPGDIHQLDGLYLDVMPMAADATEPTDSGPEPEGHEWKRAGRILRVREGRPTASSSFSSTTSPSSCLPTAIWSRTRATMTGTEGAAAARAAATGRLAVASRAATAGAPEAAARAAIPLTRWSRRWPRRARRCATDHACLLPCRADGQPRAQAVEADAHRARARTAGAQRGAAPQLLDVRRPGDARSSRPTSATRSASASSTRASRRPTSSTCTSTSGTPRRGTASRRASTPSPSARRPGTRSSRSGAPATATKWRAT